MLKRLIHLLAASTAIVSVGATPAFAGPAIAAIGAFAASGPIAGFVTNLVVGFVASAAGQLIRTWTGAKSASSAAAGGVRGAAGGSGDLPIAWLMGYRATAGTIAYRGAWGSAGKTPNAYYVEERIVSDLPMPDLTGVWVNDVKVTVDWEATPTPQGYPILEGRVGGKDHWWIRYHDGSQTVADPYMLDKFGAHPEHAYGAEMVGRGQAKVIFTALTNRDLMRSWPRLMFETTGIPLYDVSRDSTAGGSGTQRRDDPATWEPSSLLPVLIYNVLMGIRYDGQWIWGGQNTTPAQQPAASWIAAIAEARASVAKAGGGTEPQWTGGIEVSGNMEPQSVIKELIKGCAGRMAEIGGVYKMLCGLPGSAVYAFTDRDVVVTREMGYDPFPRLDSTYNAIRATYPDPAAGWSNKDAPARYSPDLETADGDRQLPIDIGYDVVSSPTQVQRLMKAAIEDARRFRRHVVSLPPDASELEVLDMVSWTSASQGYTSKAFLVVDLVDEPGYFTQVSLQEIDPADYDYDPDVDELPWSVGQLGTSRPEAQTVADFAVTPYTHLDTGANPRRPGIKMYWDGDQSDVRALQYQVRLAETEELVLTGEFVSAFAAGEGTTPAGAVLSAEDYEARAKYDPYSTRETVWTSWLPVTTPNVPEIGPGMVDWSVLSGEVQGLVNWIGATSRELVETARQSTLLAAEQDLENFDQVETLRRSLRVRLDDLQASFDEFIETAIGPGGAIATALSSLYAAMGGNSAEVLVRWAAVAAPDGVEARWALQLRIVGGVYATAGIYLDLKPDGSSSLILDATRTLITTDGGTNVEAMFNGDGAFIRDITAGTIRSEDGQSYWNLATGGFRIVVTP